MARRVVAAGLGLFLWSGLAVGEPLKYGVDPTCPALSPIRSVAARRCRELAVSDAGGTVLGRPIEIVSADHQLKPDVGLTIAHVGSTRSVSRPLPTYPCPPLRSESKSRAYKRKDRPDLGGRDPRSLRQVVLADGLCVDVRHQRASARPRPERSGIRREEVVRGRPQRSLRTPDGAGGRGGREGDLWTTGRHAAARRSEPLIMPRSFWPRRSATGRDRLVLCRRRRRAPRRERRSNSACCRRECAWRASRRRVRRP